LLFASFLQTNAINAVRKKQGIFLQCKNSIIFTSETFVKFKTTLNLEKIEAESTLLNCLIIIWHRKNYLSKFFISVFGKSDSLTNAKYTSDVYCQTTLLMVPIESIWIIFHFI